MHTQSLNHHEDREKIPRILLRAVGVLLCLVLGMVTWARVAGIEPSAMPPPEAQIVESHTIFLFGDMNGSARVLDASGQVIADLGPDEGGFIAGVARSLNLKRKQAGIDPGAPLRLVRFPDGHLGLRDDQTGWRAELIGFGKDNEAAFAKLLEQ